MLKKKNEKRKSRKREKVKKTRKSEKKKDFFLFLFRLSAFGFRWVKSLNQVQLITPIVVSFAPISRYNNDCQSSVGIKIKLN